MTKHGRRWQSVCMECFLTRGSHTFAQKGKDTWTTWKNICAIHLICRSLSLTPPLRQVQRATINSILARHRVYTLLNSFSHFSCQRTNSAGAYTSNTAVVGQKHVAALRLRPVGHGDTSNIAFLGLTLN